MFPFTQKVVIYFEPVKITMKFSIAKEANISYLLNSSAEMQLVYSAAPTNSTEHSLAYYSFVVGWVEKKWIHTLHTWCLRQVVGLRLIDWSLEVFYLGST